MKVYISVDIEGTANAVGWDSTAPGGLDYERNRLEMTKEAVAAARGAHAAGADEIVMPMASEITFSRNTCRSMWS